MARPTTSHPTSSSNTRHGTAAPRGSAAAMAGMRRWRLGGASAISSGVRSPRNSSNMLRFYTDDTPRLKISPTVVLIMRICFIGFVVVLHVFGKFYRYGSGGGA